MDASDLQAQCERGQEQLMRMEYLQAERTLAAAEAEAWADRDFDAMARLYMPLQEARRQRRQRCGEGTIRLHLLARGPDDQLNAEEIADQFHQGQLLIAGWGSIQPALELRRLQSERGLYLDTFLAAVYPAGAGRIVVIVPTGEIALPAPEPIAIDMLIRRLPAQSIVLSENELPAEDYGSVMALWERLHTPFLAAADMQADPIRKIEGYRKAIQVDYACELAHQKLSDVARQSCKGRTR